MFRQVVYLFFTDDKRIGKDLVVELYRYNVLSVAEPIRF